MADMDIIDDRTREFVAHDCKAVSHLCNCKTHSEILDIDKDTTQRFLDGEEVGQLSHGESGSGKLEGPPDGFLFVLPFLDLQSRLTVERVSKSLREAVKDNPLVWQHLHVERPASRNLTDDILLTLTKRAEGQMKTLSLMTCLRITNTALEQVLTLNAGLEKLSVPECTGVSPEAIVRLVELHSLNSRTKGMPGIKQLQIRGLYNISKDQVDLLHGILQPTGDFQCPPTRLSDPQFYGNGVEGFPGHSSRCVDVELCPICANVRVVYDCTLHWMVSRNDLACCGCTFCIPRCEECGRCIRDLSYDESLCSGLVCPDCWFSLPKCSECNRAACGQHAHRFIHGAGITFTCEECLARPDLRFSFVGEI